MSGALTWLFAAWCVVTPGVEYRHFGAAGEDIHVVRIDLTRGDLKIVATREADRGTVVSEFAKRERAVVAINADFFNLKDLTPIGLTASPCGVWPGTKDSEREGLVIVGEHRADLVPQEDVLATTEAWMKSIVSGRPMLVRDGAVLSELPGPDSFTRATHPRTAVGLSADGRTMFWVVADGRRYNVAGLTLPRLAAFMREELGVFEALNLDGGGSTAMWVDDEIVNVPSDGTERRVANHLAVVRDIRPCEAQR